jgi:hypothetical protein
LARHRRSGALPRRPSKGFGHRGMRQVVEPTRIRNRCKMLLTGKRSGCYGA